MWIFHNFLFWREKRSKSAFYFYKWNHFFQNKWNHFGSKLRHKEVRLWDGFKLLRVKKQQFQWEEFRKKAVSGLGYFGKQHDRTSLSQVDPLSSISGSFNAFFWISNLVGEALKSDFLFLFLVQKLQFGASVDVGRGFSRFRPVDPPNQWYTTVRS